MATNVNGVSNTSSSNGLGGSGSASAAQEIQDQFLTLLVTQLRNQDPLNPMQNAELTSQLAQISTVEGITNLNNTLLAISGQVDVSQSMNAAALIGRGVLVPGNEIALGTDAQDATKRSATPVGIDLQADAAEVEVKVLDSAGNVVRTMKLGKQDTGVLDVTWDGKNDGGQDVADGKYTFTVAATDAEGKRVEADALQYGLVNGVAYGTNGLRLQLGMGKQASMLDIRKIYGNT
ncbi:flagellar hook capping FlgD N-terminal domain-containing protein [Bordetella genomosp. 13]|uniref:Basal-body rod modification protein FlgD n=1 Tax=Bordetella genomosp. 13 TaxID=463040 RepID=A0A1W6ZAG5_9BORD|nr:flagellar hook capping FlgD N-terminal domain-containing protein [Bordetella genomosp. 13]ARP94317.1 flagellar basal body rod modification protein [Bordetella genomosp. 13]